MENSIKLPKEVIAPLIQTIPNSGLYKWLNYYPCPPGLFFTNQKLLSQTLAVSMTLSGGLAMGNAFSLEVVRKKENGVAIDIHPITLSDDTILVDKKIIKDANHHLSILPPWHVKVI